MSQSTLIAVLVAPFLEPVFYWLWRKPGWVVHDWVWKHLPYGKLRSILLTPIKYID